MAPDHAPNEALKILADKASTRLPRSLVGAFFLIGLREQPDAGSEEWALIRAARAMLGPRQQGKLH